MAKYRLLTDEELNELQKEFVDYLILNGIVAADWVKLKNEDPEGANKIIHLFSDVVFEKIMRTTQFLELRRNGELRILQCLEDRFVVTGLDASNIQGVDFNDAEYLKEVMRNPPLNVKIFTTEILYKNSREEELFKMTELGYQISDGKLFKTLCLMLPK